MIELMREANKEYSLEVENTEFYKKNLIEKLQGAEIGEGYAVPESPRY